MAHVPVPLPTHVPPATPGARVLRIRGGNTLRGGVTVCGAKNAALKALAATLLTSDEVVLNNVPMLADVVSTAELLRAFGAEVEIDKEQERVAVRAREIVRTDAPERLFNATRASVVVAGPILARCGAISFSMPGGDEIGKRPIDMHLRGFQRMGAEVVVSQDGIAATARKLKGSRIYMDYPSHTGTETIMMAATLATGRTVIVNASAEPEVVWLGSFLGRMGARISGLGTPIITIEGVERLQGASDIVPPDRLEAGTFAIAAAMTRGEVTIEGVIENQMLPITEKLLEMGVDVWHRENAMLVRPGSGLRAVDIQTLPYPGFPTDVQAPFVAMLTQADGVSRIHERVYEDRLRYAFDLIRMGAGIELDLFGDNRATSATVTGPARLHGERVEALDIRSAAAIVLAGLVADGETELLKPHHIDRGYARFVEKLAGIGGNVKDAVLPV